MTKNLIYPFNKNTDPNPDTKNSRAPVMSFELSNTRKKNAKVHQQHHQPRHLHMPIDTLSPALRNHPFSTYPPITQFICKILDFSQTSRRVSLIRWTTFLFVSVVISNITFQPSHQAHAAFLGVILMFVTAHFVEFVRGTLKFFGLSLQQLRAKRNYFKQTMRYPQLPHRQDKFAMLGTCQWFRWQCFVDAVFYNALLGPLRVKHEDLRDTYQTEKKLWDFSNRVDIDKSTGESLNVFHFDFVADTGDSFNGTYSVACCNARDMNDVIGCTEKLPKPSLMVHGGDVSYPWPAEHEIVNRYILPLQYALPSVGSNHQRGSIAQARKPAGSTASNMSHQSEYTTDSDGDNDSPASASAFASASAPASVESNGEPALFILPGNHEWIDGLQCFHDLFIDKENKMQNLGDWSLPQRSSYFALKLPGDWWIFVVDCIDGAVNEVAKDIDDFQFEYFASVYNDKVDQDKDSIILTSHIPEYFWNSVLGYSKGPRLHQLRKSLGDNFAMMMCGDMHFYRRYGPETKVEKQRGVRRSVVQGNVMKDTSIQDAFPMLFVVGGGGGFSHSTANPKGEYVKVGYPFEDEPKTFVTKKEYPTPKQCNEFFYQRIFVTRHPGLWRMLGFLYMIIASGWLPNRASKDGQSTDITDMMLTSLGSGKSFSSYIAILTLFIIFNAFTTANYSGSRFFFMKAGLLALFHTFLHVCCAYTILSVIVTHGITVDDFAAESAESLVLDYWGILLVQFLVGGTVGHVLVMTYFCVMFGVFNYHWNEAYCGIEDEDHKNFIRCRVNLDDGSLDVFAIGIDEVPKKWKENPDKTNEPCLLWPLDQDKINAHLIEKVSIPKLIKRKGISSREIGMQLDKYKSGVLNTELL